MRKFCKIFTILQLFYVVNQTLNVSISIFSMKIGLVAKMSFCKTELYHSALLICEKYKVAKKKCVYSVVIYGYYVQFC